MKRSSKLLISMVLSLILIFSANFNVFAYSAVVPDYEVDTDFWWSGWEDYSYNIVYQTIYYQNAYELNHTSTSEQSWWEDGVLFRSVTTNYYWTVR